MKKVAVIIPFYKNEISVNEGIALQQCERILSNYPIIAIKPHHLTLTAGTGLINFADTVSFDDAYFKSIAGYNNLMLSTDFYNRFLDYEYVLIYQLDTFVFKDQLDYWSNQSYDYIGAPWIRKTYHKSFLGLMLLRVQQYFSRILDTNKKITPNKYQMEHRVGNGGFSLRRVQKFHDLCISMKPMIDFYLAQTHHLYNEDIFWSIQVNIEKENLNIPDWQIGLKFAFEVPPVKSSEINDQNLPFGCHDWDKYTDYWKPIFKRYNFEI